MRTSILLIGLALLWISLPSARATPQEDYLKIYLARKDAAENLEKKGDLSGALKAYQDRYGQLQKLKLANPNWEAGLTKDRLEDCHSKILELRVRINQKARTSWTSPTLLCLFASRQPSIRGRQI